MTPQEINDQARKLIMQAEAKLAEKNRKELVDAIRSIKIEQPSITVNPPQVNVPKIEIPPIKIPPIPTPPKQEIIVKQEQKDIDVSGIEKVLKEAFDNFKLPENKINIPAVKIPKLQWPEGEMPISGLVTLAGVDLNNPLPVQLRDSKGKPVSFPEFIGGGGGGRSISRIGGIDASAWGGLLTPDGRLKTDGGGGSSSGGLTDAELRATAVPVSQVSGAIDSVKVTGFDASVGATILNGDGASLDPRDRNWSITEQVPVTQVSGHTWSVSVNDIFRTTVASNLINADDRLRVSLEPGGSGLTDSELRATSVPVSQVSGAMDSVNVAQINGQTPSLNSGDADAGTSRVIQARSANATTTAVSVGADASTNIAPTNTARKSISITHNSSYNLYVSTGTASSANSFPIVANQTIIFDDYVGPINAIADNQAGTISVRYIEII